MIEVSAEYNDLRINFKVSFNSKFKKTYLNLRLNYMSKFQTSD
jgi:hypothetical protein